MDETLRGKTMNPPREHTRASRLANEYVHKAHKNENNLALFKMKKFTSIQAKVNSHNKRATSVVV